MKNLKNILTLLAISIPLLTHGQIKNGEGFLQGQHVQIGVSSCGSYGTVDSIPSASGYQTANNFNQGLGFVADPDRDGWGVGTPNFCGDYFLPGDPEEGFTIYIGGTNYSNNNGGGAICSSNDFIGTVGNYVDAGGKVSVEWNGTGNGLEINQFTYMNKDSLYFTTKVILTNISGSLLSDIHYLRNVDPDNENFATGIYTTDNFIHYQNPSLSNRALVYAKGTTHGCFLGIGTNDSRAKVSYGGFTNRDAKAVYDGTAPFNHSGSNTADQAISIAFKLGDLDTGETVCFYFAHILDSTQLDAAISTTSISPTFLADSNDITSGGFYIACSGDSVDLSITGDSGFFWTWTPSTNLSVDTGHNVVAWPSVTTMYTVKGTKDCSFYTYNLMVMITPPPLVNLGPDTTICDGEDVTIFAGNPGSQYLWSTGDTTDRITVSDSGMFWLIVTNCNLSDTDSINVFLDPTPVVDIGNDTTFCSGGSMTLDAGNPGMTYKWNTFANTQTINVNITNAYIVTVTDGQCSASDTMVLTVDPTPTVNLGPDLSFCAGDTFLLDAGNPGATYLWSTGATTQTISTTTPDTFWVVTTLAACVDEDTMVLNLDTPPVLQLRADTTVCNGEVVVVDAGNPGMTYSWSTGDTTQAIDAATTNSYFVTVTNGACVREDSFDLTVIDIPIIDLGVDTIFCDGHIHTLTAPIGYTYNWSTGDTVNEINVSTSGIYVVTASNQGCIAVDTAVIVVNANPVISLGEPEVICEYESVVLTPGGLFQYYDWSTGETENGIVAEDPGTYWVVVTDNNDCISDTAKKDIIGKICKCTPQEVYMPNVFTPLDFKNNIFYPRGTDALKIKMFQIYNRWGEVVFEVRNTEINDASMGWDGTYKGAILPPQVFAYFVQAECFDGSEVIVKGNVTLLK